MRIPFTNLNLKGFTVNRLPGQENEILSQNSFTGIHISEETALTYTAYWACVRLLAGTLASLPLITYKRLSQGKERATDHPNYFLLHDEPNPEMDSFTFLETYMSHLVTTGNAYSLIDWEDNVRIKALWIMRPDRISVTRDENKNIVYKYSIDGQGQITLPSYRVWHTPGLGYDGLVGYSPIAMVRQAVGLGLATEKMGAELFGNGLTVGGTLEHPGKMSDEAQKRFLATIKARHQGIDKAHELLILEEGMKFNKNNIPPEDAQFLDTRKYQKREMATFFLIQPHKIGDMEQATFGNIEEQNIEFVVDTMRPWAVRIEKSAKRKLFLPNEKADYFSEFLMDGLLRGNVESRYRAYSIGRNWGWLSANDVLEMENKNPIPNGDVYMSPSNMVSAEQFNNQTPKAPASIPPKP